MTTGATGQLGLALPVQGELSGTWGDTVNNGITQYTNIAIAATLTLTNDGAVTLANTTGDASASNITSSLTGAGTVTAQFAIVRITGTLTTTKVVTAPSYSKTYVVVNAATGGTVTFKASGQTGVSIAVGESAWVYYNGTDYVKIVGTATAGAAGGSNTQVQYNSSGSLAGSSAFTFDGTTVSSPVVQSTNGTITTVLSYSGGNSTGIVGTTSNHSLEFRQNNTEGMRLTSTGLGIGTSSPANKLVVSASNPTRGLVAKISNSGSSGLTGSQLHFEQNTIGDWVIGQPAGVDALAIWNNRYPAADGTERLRIDSAGNLGLGVTPSAWATYKAFDIGYAGNGLHATGQNDLNVASNVYYNAGYKYAGSARANLLEMYNGEFYFKTAGSGTAGNAITFTQAMTLDASGNLGVGTTSPAIAGYARSLIVDAGSSNYSQMRLSANNGSDLTFYSTGTSAITGQVSVDSTSGSNPFMTFRVNGSEQARIDSSGNLLVGTTATAAAKLTIVSTTNPALTLPNIAEIATISATAATGTINYDATTQSVLYYTTNASGNFTMNIRGNSGLSLNSMMSTGQSVTMAFLCTNGSTAYYQSAMTIDGSSVTPKWQGGTAPSSGNASSIDVYSYTIIKTASATFTVLASQTKFA